MSSQLFEEEQRGRGIEFRTILSYKVSLRTAWVTWDHVLEHINRIKRAGLGRWLPQWGVCHASRRGWIQSLPLTWPVGSPMIQTLGQEKPGSLLASQFSQISELQVQSETLPHNEWWGAINFWLPHLHACTHAHKHTDMCTNVCAHTHTYRKTTHHRVMLGTALGVLHWMWPGSEFMFRGILAAVTRRTKAKSCSSPLI